MDFRNILSVNAKVPSRFCISCSQSYTKLRSYTTSISILFLACCVICILNSYGVKNVLFITIYLCLCNFFELITQILSLELNYPKTSVCSCTRNQTVISMNVSYVNDIIKLNTLRVHQRNIACSQLCINRRYTNQQAVLANVILTILECQLLVSSLSIYREYILLLSSLYEVQGIIIEAVYISLSEIVQLNVSYHCRVLTDDVLQLSLNVCNLCSETELSIIVLNTVQNALDSTQT